MKKPSRAQLLKQEEDYVNFLKKRLESKNFRNNVSSEEYEKTRLKYEKAKLKLKFPKES